MPMCLVLNVTRAVASMIPVRYTPLLVQTILPRKSPLPKVIKAMSSKLKFTTMHMMKMIQSMTVTQILAFPVKNVIVH